MTIVELRGPLDHDLGDKVALAIRAARGVVDLRISSPGGKFGAAIAVLLEIEETTCAVITTIEGEAASAAALIAIAGDRRRIGSESKLMLHFPSWPVGMTAPPDERAAAAVDVLRAVCERVPASPADIRKWMNEERIFTAREAQAAGLVDVIADGPLPLYLRPIPKRQPATWLRQWRDDFERFDLRPAQEHCA